MAHTETVALVADTHGFLDPRIAGIARACRHVVHAGDVGAESILATLAADGANVVTVAGNNDTPEHWPAADRATLEALPGEAELPLPGGTLVVVHGDRYPARVRHARLRRDRPDAAAIVCGHSHRLTVDTEDTPWVLNPGAAGRSRTYGGPSCIVLQAAADGWQIEPHRFPSPPRQRPERHR